LRGRAEAKFAEFRLTRKRKNLVRQKWEGEAPAEPSLRQAQRLSRSFALPPTILLERCKQCNFDFPMDHSKALKTLGESFERL
jgi:hypothetical protein